MAGIKGLIGMALSGSASMTLLILACTLHQQNWWPAIVTIFYTLVPFPIMVSKYIGADSSQFGGQSNPSKEWAYFLTTGIVISAIALPIVLAGIKTIEVVASILSIMSSIFAFSTILAFFIVFQSSDSSSDGFY